MKKNPLETKAVDENPLVRQPSYRVLVADSVKEMEEKMEAIKKAFGYGPLGGIAAVSIDEEIKFIQAVRK